MGWRCLFEVKYWQGHSSEAIKAMNDHLELLPEQGIEHIDCSLSCKLLAPVRNYPGMAAVRTG